MSARRTFSLASTTETGALQWGNAVRKGDPMSTFEFLIV